MKREEAGGIVLAQDNRSGRLSYWQGQTHQSVADRDGVSLAPYIHALYGLIRQKRARRVLIIGCGGGSLATMLAKAKVHVTLVDTERRAFAIARRYFHMPDRVECHVGDGARFLRRHRRRYDVVVLDAFADGEVPRHLATVSFFFLVKSRLRAKGMFLANIVVLEDPLLARWRSRLGQVWRAARLLDAAGEKTRNAILAAGAVKALRRPHLCLKPKTGARSLARDLARFSFADVAAKSRGNGFMRARRA